MRLNDIRATTSSGGTGTLTLTRQTGWALPSDAWTGTRLCEYTIIEWTDSTKTVPLQTESGIGSIVCSTLVLTRSKINQTWLPSGPTYLPLFGSSTAPSAINFGTTSANIDVVIGPTANGGPLRMPARMAALASVSGGNGIPPLNIISVANATASPGAGTTYYYPILIGHDGPFSQASMKVQAAVTGGTPTLSVAIYEIQPPGGTLPGAPGKKLIDFGSLGTPTTTSLLQNSALSTPVDIGLGWFWMGVLYVANGATGSLTVAGGSGGWGPQGYLAGTYYGAGASSIISQTALNDPATAPTGATQGNFPMVFFL